MINPFYPFTGQLLKAFVNRGKTFFVRQTFTQVMGLKDQHIKQTFLFSQYENFTTAQDHFGAIAFDPNRFLYNWADPAHREKLTVAATGFKDYKVFANVFRTDWEKLLPAGFHKKVQAYVRRLGWNPAAGENISSHFEVQFGELFIRLKFRGREAKVKFEEIEKIT